MKKDLTIADCRPEVVAFAVLMERELRLNDHKGGWKKDDAYQLAKHMVAEAIELRDALQEKLYEPIYREATPEEINQPGRHRMYVTTSGQPRKVMIADHLEYRPWTAPARVASEAADLANMAMMVADVCGGFNPSIDDATDQAIGMLDGTSV